MSLPNLANLNESYSRLKNLVSQEITDSSLKEIKKILDEAAPENAEEAAQAALLRRLTKSSYRAADNIIIRSRCPGLILWAGAPMILWHFRLQKKLYIKWNGEYVVKYFEKKNPDNNS